MNDLLDRIIDAHGGMDRWDRHEKVEVTIVSGGGLFALKGILQDSNPRRIYCNEEPGAMFKAERRQDRGAVFGYGRPFLRFHRPARRVEDAPNSLDRTRLNGLP